MNKELTPLETWYLVKKYLNEFHHRIVSEDIEVKTIEGHPINIIETALKDYELMKQPKIIVVDKKISDDDLEKLINQGIIVGNLEQSKIEPLFDNETQKKLKALEIIKEKILDMDYFNIIADRCDLTYQEYELLRNVLK